MEQTDIFDFSDASDNTKAARSDFAPPLNDPQGSVERNLFSAIADLVGQDKAAEIDFERKIDLAKQMERDHEAATRDLRQKAIGASQSYTQLLQLSGRVKAEWTFEQIQHDELNSQAISAARSFCDTSGVAPQRILVVTGNPGSGKTVLCNALANYYMKNTGRRVCYTSLAAVKELRFSAGEREDEFTGLRFGEYRALVECALLIIDPLVLGNTPLTPFENRVLCRLCTQHYEHGGELVLTLPKVGATVNEYMELYCADALHSYEGMRADLLGESRRNKW
ncbi:MAG: ATP-binding protein [Succinivibrio sp.]|nr:ATP-binding protein [Succinivibrio sp.]